MKRLTKVLPSALLALILALSLTACGSNQGSLQVPATPKNVVVISGNIQTSATKVLPDAAITKLVDCLLGGGEISVIVPDSNPRLTRLDPITRPNGAMDDTWREYLKLLLLGDAETEGLEEQINLPSPRKPGYDLCEALSLAARQNPDVIIIAGSGLTVSGALDFTQGNLLLSDDEQLDLIAEKLVSGRHLPDLAGINIVWYGLGEVAGEQQPLPAQAHTVLEDIWYTVLYETGANVEFRPANVDSDADLSAYPDVSLVEIPVDMEGLQEVYDYEVPEIVQPIRLNDARLNFVMDQDVFIDPAEAEAALTPYALGLIKSGQEVYILGMTAITEDSVTRLNQLSLDRATRIKDVLVTLGVPESQISCVGTGSLSNAFRSEPDTVGSIVNRAAVLVDAEDDRIKDILNGEEGVDFYED